VGRGMKPGTPLGRGEGCIPTPPMGWDMLDGNGGLTPTPGGGGMDIAPAVQF
jgi:hypothetical protein